MSPIFTRPYREQHEHDRIIRQLQARYRRKHEVVINPGPEQHGSVTVGELPVFPDLLLYSQEPTQHLEATVEVETGESVHLLEARAEWGVFSQVPVPFILYVPATMLETARRLIDEQQWRVSEIWTYLPGMDQLRFLQVFRHPNPPVVVAPKMQGRARVKAVTPALKAQTPAGAPATQTRKATGTAAKPSVKAAAKPVARASAKPVAKASAKAVPARPAAKAAAKAASPTRASKATSKPVSKATPAHKKAVAKTKASPKAGKKATVTHTATTASKKSPAAAKKKAAVVRSAPAKSAPGRTTASKKSASSGKAGRRR